MADIDSATQTPQDLEARLNELSALYKSGHLKSLAPLTCLLNLQGHPMSLKNHFMFRPMYSMQRPRKRILKCGRQVSKSVTICADGSLLALVVPAYKILFITPLFSQVKRLSTDYIQYFMEGSMFRDEIVGPDSMSNILQRTYYNRSEHLFSYAFTSALRIRSISGIHDVRIDELQSFNREYIPIVGEVMSGVTDYGFFTYSGTPLTCDNLIEEYWQESSQGEPAIRCRACGKENIACISQDALKMIGPLTVWCAKCQKPLNPYEMYYAHRFPERRFTFPGWHVPQIIHPVHCRFPAKWAALRDKLEGPNAYSTAQFNNEVLGESYDKASGMVTAADLYDACQKGRKNDLETARKAIKHAGMSALCVDWTGAGASNTSTTVFALLTVPANASHIEVSYIERVDRKISVQDEIRKLVWLFRELHPDYLVHDYGGAGNVREALMLEMGIPADVIVPMAYGWNITKPIIRFVQGTTAGARTYYDLDKARSLAVTCVAIKAKQIKFPDWDQVKDLISDFTALTENAQVSPHGNSYVIIGLKPGRSDDVSAAVNMGAAAMWYRMGTYPNLSGMVASAAQDEKDMDPEIPDWITVSRGQ